MIATRREYCPGWPGRRGLRARFLSDWTVLTPAADGSVTAPSDLAI